MPSTSRVSQMLSSVVLPVDSGANGQEGVDAKAFSLTVGGVQHVFSPL